MAEGTGKTVGPIMTPMQEVPGNPSQLGPSGGAVTGGQPGMEKQSGGRIDQVMYVTVGGLKTPDKANG